MYSTYVTVLFKLCLYCSETVTVATRRKTAGSAAEECCSNNRAPAEFIISLRYVSSARTETRALVLDSFCAVTQRLLREFLRVTVHSTRSLGWLGPPSCAATRIRIQSGKTLAPLSARTYHRCWSTAKASKKNKKNNKKSQRLPGSGCLQQNLLWTSARLVKVSLWSFINLTLIKGVACWHAVRLIKPAGGGEVISVIRWSAWSCDEAAEGDWCSFFKTKTKKQQQQELSTVFLRSGQLTGLFVIELFHQRKKWVIHMLLFNLCTPVTQRQVMDSKKKRKENTSRYKSTQPFSHCGVPIQRRLQTLLV